MHSNSPANTATPNRTSRGGQGRAEPRAATGHRENAAPAYPGRRLRWPRWSPAIQHHHPGARSACSAATDPTGPAAAGRAPGSADRWTSATPSAGAATSRLRVSHTAYDAGAPWDQGAGDAVRTLPARHAPRSRRRTPHAWRWHCRGVMVARGPHGRPWIQGGHRASEPKAGGTPADANSANGLSRAARSTPRRRAYMPRRRPTVHRSSAACWHDPHAPNLVACSSDTISRCSAGAHSGPPPGRRTAHDGLGSASTTAAAAASPMTWNPAVTPVGAGRQVFGDHRAGPGSSCRSGPGRRHRVGTTRRCAIPARRRRTGPWPARPPRWRRSARGPGRQWTPPTQ